MSQDSIPSYLDANFFTRVLQSGLFAPQVKIKDVDLQDITTDGENYCSNIYKALITYDLNSQQEKIRVVIKSMTEDKQAPLKRLNIFSKETFFYQELQPKIEALLMPFGENWNFGAKFLYSCSSPEETIVFQDLSCSGFFQKCRQTGLDLEHSKIVFKKLAQYHAVTIFLNEKTPGSIKSRYPFGLLNMESIKTVYFKALFGGQLLKLIDLLKDKEDFQTIIPKLKQYHEQFFERVLKAVYPLEGALNVLNHGDLWINNLFFKYETITSVQPEEVQFIDFQLCFFGSLGFDVNYFLNTSAQMEVLKSHRQNLVNLYCEEFLLSLKKLPSKQPLPSKEQILKEIHHREAYGFFVSFAFFPLMSMISIDSQNNSLENLQNAEFAKQKIDLMFTGNPRTLETLQYALKRFNDLGVFN